MQLSDINLRRAKFNTERGADFSLYFILLIMVIVALYAYSVHFLYGFSLYPDEFGYWSSAAAAVGYDWSEVTSLGYYYSFGYALILIPILKIFGGSTEAFRAAIAVNAALQCISVWLLHYLVDHIFFKDPESEGRSGYRNPGKLLAVTAAVLYPVWIYYMQLSMVEAVLAFVYILVGVLAVRYFEKPGKGRLLPVLVALTYMYYLHMRTIAVFIAGIITLVIHAMRTGSADISGTRKRTAIRVAVILAYAAMAIIAGELIKSAVMDSAYAHSTARQLATNDYAGQIGRLKVLTSLSGYTGVIKSIIAKLMYLGMSSFGMIYIALIYLCRCVYRLFKAPVDRAEQSDGYAALFILATGTAQFLLIAVANIGGRLDGLPYGRYIEHTSPVLIAIGVYALMELRYRYRYAIGTAIYYAISVFVTVGWSISAGTDSMHSFCIAGISYLWNVWELDIVYKYIVSFVVAVVTMTVMYICVYMASGSISPETRLARKVKPGAKLSLRMAAAPVICIIMTVTLGMHLSYMYVYPSSRADELDGRIVRYIESDSSGYDKDAVRVVYLSEGKPPYIDIIQFGLKDISVHVLRTRSRGEERENVYRTTAADETVTVKWVKDADNDDYDGTGDMYRLDEESVIRVLQGYEKSEKLYVISDISSGFEGILTERYRCVMDTLWMKLYVCR